MTNLNLLAPVWSHLTNIQPVRGAGIYLYDAAGNQYADFTSGIGVTNTGHCHPAVVTAVQEQAAQLIFGQVNIVIQPQAIQLAEKLNAITPPRIDRFFFSNSGSEAVEGAVKLARKATQRRNIIVFQGSFHGRTHQAMAMTTSKTIYRQGYQPLPAGVFVAPFPYGYYYGMDDHEVTEFCMRQIDMLLHGQTAPEETAAFVIEPVLGEGGYVPAPPEFMQRLRALCDQHGILLVVDEVQSGFGRTGKMFAFEHVGIEPDIIIMAKGLASGMPISAIGSRADLMAKWQPGTHGGTYGGGNGPALAAAAATIDVIQNENLVENAAELGDYLMDSLNDLKAEYPVIGDVRGRGLMVGVEFTDGNGRPDPITPLKVQQVCLDNNLLLLICGSYKNVMRLIPPLVVTKSQLDTALSIINEGLAAAT